MMGLFNKKDKGPSQWEIFQQHLNRIETRFAEFEQSKVDAQRATEVLNAKIDEILAAKAQVEDENDNLKQELKVFREKDATDKAKYDSDEPWVEIKSEGFDETKGIALGLDWNQAFIKHLHDSGLGGTTEEDTVRKWVAFLYQDLLERLEAEVEQQASAKGKIADYE